MSFFVSLPSFSFLISHLKDSDLSLPHIRQCSYDIDVPLSIKMFDVKNKQKLSPLFSDSLTPTNNSCSLEGIEGRRRRESMTPNLDRPFVQNARLYGGPFPDIYVTIELVSSHDGRSLLPFNARTSYRAFTTQCKWDESVQLAVKFRDLPPTTRAVFTVWDVHGPKQAAALGHATLPLYGRRGVLRKGRQKLLLSEGTADGGGRGGGGGGGGSTNRVPMSAEVERLERLIKKHGRAELEHVEWLDAFTFTKIERIKRDCEKETDEAMFLFVELPIFAHPVIYVEMPAVPPAPPPDTAKTPGGQKTAGRASRTIPGPAVVQAAAAAASAATPAAGAIPQQGAAAAAVAIAPTTPSKRLSAYHGERYMPLIVMFPDPELGLENPVEQKYLKLARSSHRVTNLLAQDLKPNNFEVKRIAAILRYPPTHELSYEDKDLLWRFASYLSKNKKALPK